MFDWYTLLIIIFGLLFAFISSRYLRWALIAIALLLPSYGIRFDVLGIPFTLLEIMIISAFGGFLYRYRFSWISEVRSHPLRWPIGLFLLAATISIFTSDNTIAALGIYKAYIIEPLLYFMMLCVVLITRRDWQWLIGALGLSAAAISAIGIWQFFSGWNVPLAFRHSDGSVDRIVSLYSYPNAIGLYVGPIIVLLFALLLSAKNIWIKLTVAAGITVSLIAIILAESEASLVALVAAAVVIGLLLPKWRWWSAGVVVAIVIALTTLPQLREIVLPKLLLQDYSGMIRRLIWGETWQMLRDNWLWGAGLSGYQTAIAPYHQHTRFEIFMYPHNIIFNFWSELGLAGLAAFGWLIIKQIYGIVQQVYQKNIAWSLVALGATVHIVIHGLVDAPFFKNDLAVLFWIIIALGVALQNKSFAVTK